MEGLFDVYSGVAGNLAKHLCIFGVDSLANDRQDYKVILQLECLKLQKRFRKLHGFNVMAEHRYVCKGLWNYCRDIYKTRCQRNVAVTVFEDFMEADKAPASTRKREMESRIEAKDAIKILEKFLPHGDMKLLRHWVFCDCRIEPDIRGGMTKKQIRHQIRLAKAKAKKILEE